MNRTQFSLEVSGGGWFQICCFIMYCIVKCSSLFEVKSVILCVCLMAITSFVLCGLCSLQLLNTV